MDPINSVSAALCPFQPSQASFSLCNFSASPVVGVLNPILPNFLYTFYLEKSNEKGRLTEIKEKAQYHLISLEKSMPWFPNVKLCYASRSNMRYNQYCPFCWNLRIRLLDMQGCGLYLIFLCLFFSSVSAFISKIVCLTLILFKNFW